MRVKVKSLAGVTGIGNTKTIPIAFNPIARLQSVKRYGLRTPRRHSLAVCTKGVGDSVVGSWLELSKLVTSDASEHKSAFPELAHDIGAEVYVDFNGWHLYLKDISVTTDVKLHTVLAQKLAPDLLARGFDEGDVESLLKKVPLSLGGGKAKVSLYDSIPAYALSDLMNICRRFAEEN